jgi:hypothetical protein
LKDETFFAEQDAGPNCEQTSQFSDVCLQIHDFGFACSQSVSFAFGDLTTMKANLTTLLVSLTLAGVIGCSTSTSRVASHHEPAPVSMELADARVLYMMGRLDVAEQKLEAVLQKEPGNAKARYYLTLVHAAQYRRESGQEQPWIWGYYQTIPPQPIYR